ncbi:MAG: Holliday junction branch migration protein RuvA [Hyphomicrobiales bacterium]|nr:Holliday junction branch migration protein RuvA [Hyphomicrobiales bacterium]
MIGRLRGIVDTVGADFLILDVGGVGYEVACGSRTLAHLPAQGELVTLAIETYVREDAIKLYGFASEAERAWFRLLQSVQGVGAKVALSILGAVDVGTLANAIALQDKTAMTRAPGVGPKVALRIMTELKDKAPSLMASGIGAGTTAAPGRTTPAAVASPAGDAISALVNLGYAPQQANSAIATVLAKSGEAARAEDLIRLGLKELSR